MRVKEEAICKVCKRVFCCAECRRKHEIKTHAIVVKKPILLVNNNNNNNNEIISGGQNPGISYVMCPICENKPFPFYQQMYEEVLEHIARKHLPLHCRRCSKIYDKAEDLKEFSKCINASVQCDTSNDCSSSTNDQTCDTDTSKVTVTKASPKKLSTISTQTSPMPKGLHESHLTPISLLNMRWKVKNQAQDEFSSDSVSSIKNNSSIDQSSIRRSSIATELIGKAKLIRSTSTPVQLGVVLMKNNEQGFDGSSGGHVSSIYSSTCESDTSPALPVNTAVTPKKGLENLNRYRKGASRPKPKLAAVTPLRQVMSKSIQKAFAEHGGLPTKQDIHQRNNLVDSVNSRSDLSEPLDLRSSPVIRRSQSEGISSSPLNTKEKPLNLVKEKKSNNCGYMLATHKQTTETIIITSTSTEERIDLCSGFGKTVKRNDFSSEVNGSEQMSVNIENSSNTSSVFRSCHSVDIITSSEMSSLERQICNTTQEDEDKLEALPAIHTKNHYHLATKTPKTRQSVSNIQKKLIKFETPRRNLMSIAEPLKNNDLENKNSSSPGELFFTPNSTPVQESLEKSISRERRRELAARNLTHGFSPFSRVSLKNCAQSTAFSRIECSAAYEEESFMPQIQSSKAEDFSSNSEENKNEKEKISKLTNTISNNSNNVEQGEGAGSIWSLMSSVIRLPSFRTSLTDRKDTKIEKGSKPNSIIKRCASIAGSLVRSNSLVDEEQYQNLKRKRTYTADHSPLLTHLNLGEYSPAKSLATKRFRIQGRPPIRRFSKDL